MQVVLTITAMVLVKNKDEHIKRMADAQQQIFDELCRQNDRLDKERERTERTDRLIEKILKE